MYKISIKPRITMYFLFPNGIIFFKILNKNVQRESTDGGSRLTSPRTPRLTPAAQTRFNHSGTSKRQSQHPSFRFIQYVFLVSGAKTSELNQRN